MVSDFGEGVGCWPHNESRVEQWETKEHQQVHISQPHMAQLREFKGDYITNTLLGEVALL